MSNLEEILEVLTSAKLGIHRKPAGLLDAPGYRDGRRHLIARAVAEGFVRPEYATLLLADTDPARRLDRFAAWEPPDGPRVWLDETET